MGSTDGTKAAQLEGIIRSVSKKIYGKGPRDIRCICRGNIFLVWCEGILSPVECGLADQEPGGVAILKQARYKLFDKERELIKKQFENSHMEIETILQEFHHDKDKRLLVVLTKTR